MTTYRFAADAHVYVVMTSRGVHAAPSGHCLLYTDPVLAEAVWREIGRTDESGKLIRFEAQAFARDIFPDTVSLGVRWAVCRDGTYYHVVSFREDLAIEPDLSVPLPAWRTSRACRPRSPRSLAPHTPGS